MTKKEIYCFSTLQLIVTLSEYLHSRQIAEETRSHGILLSTQIFL